MQSASKHVEWLASYARRKYSEFLVAVGIVVVLLLGDIPAALGQFPISNGFLVYNLALLGVTIGLIIMGRMRRNLRRYVVEDYRVTFPVWRDLIPSGLPLSTIVFCSLEPSSSRRLVGAVELTISKAPADGIATVAANTSDFGSHNLDDLLARLPPETMAPGYAWEYRDSLTRRRRR